MTKVKWLAAAGACCLLALGAGGLLDDAGAEEAAKGFATPEAAVEALIAAGGANDDGALMAIFGSKAQDLVMSGSDPVVKKEREELAAIAKARRSLRDNRDGSKTLVVGDDDWPLPFPLVKGEDGQWRFDAEQGREEILARRIGRNELRALDICRIYADAQLDYAADDRDDDDVREYAQRLRSSTGARDGLYWPAKEGELQSPLGPLVSSWRDHLEGAKDGKRVPVGGYYFRILTGQGRDAPGGRHSYIINGNMIAGFALIAYPAEYGNTGVMSFLISHHGAIYERDLGAQTARCARAMACFNPGAGWQIVKED
ncbi:MAG: DUF2950 domain-containing protein [Planctomycetota bacterium]|nr:DUF2950 domain-containing protein [Planctomycetota bacterium]